MQTSTDRLNQAVERMSTGFKINHASDNAANYSISTNITTQLNAYDVAADNVAMGMDLVTTAMNIVSNMQDKATRLRALSTQARNGTFGAQSMAAINTEAAAIMAEITRLYSTAEYNDISLFNRKAYEIADHLPKAGTSGFIDETALISMAAAGERAGTTTEAPKAKAEYNGFIENPKTYTDAEVAAMPSLSEAYYTSNIYIGGVYKISTTEDLAVVAELLNYTNLEDLTFVLANDIDLEQCCADNIADGGWNPIGTISKPFKGTFDGNGHVIKNLKIDRETSDYQGLFGYISDDAEIKNIALENVSVTGQGNYVGGLAGYSYGDITNSYAMGNVTGQGNYVGGLAGSSSSSSITNSYATGTVSGTDRVGGLAGNSSSSITNSYATGTVSGTDSVGGLVGYSSSSSSSITNSYATGTVSGTDRVGGLAGYSSSSITNSYAIGNVTGQGNYVGGLAGYSSSSSITNSYATGTVSGTDSVGGLAGYSYGDITNSYATGTVSGTDRVGGLAGSSSSSSITNSYATGAVSGTGGQVGGLAGYSSSSSITNSYATGTVSGTDSVGGLAGILMETSPTATRLVQ